MQALEYSVRLSRPANTPRLQGLYIFGKRDSPESSTPESCIKNSNIAAVRSLDRVMSIKGAQIGAEYNQRSRDALSSSLEEVEDGAYGRLGAMFSKPPMKGWERTLQACKGLINFDGILCGGPRHSHILGPPDEQLDKRLWYLKRAAHLPVAVAMIALKGCSSCHSAPEGITTYGVTPPEDLPLLAPPPFHSSTIKAGTRSNLTINGKKARLLYRCRDCLRGRYCESCHKWWCEDCYEISVGNESLKPPQAVISGFLATSYSEGTGSNNFKVYMGLCVEDCLVGEMMSGAGSSGMWG